MSLTDEKLHNYVNSSGFPLQIGLEHQINKSGGDNSWKVLYSEHSWKNYDTGSSGFIDLVLTDRHGTSVMVVEATEALAKEESHLFKDKPDYIRIFECNSYNSRIKTARYNIKINTVAPNASTGMTQGVFTDEVAKRIRPEFNTPIVTYLCSEENQESGMIFTMSAGWFARSAMVSGKGYCIGDTKRLIKAEEIRDQFDQIKSLDNALPYEHCGQIYSLGKPLTGR